MNCISLEKASRDLAVFKEMPIRPPDHKCRKRECHFSAHDRSGRGSRMVLLLLTGLAQTDTDVYGRANDLNICLRCEKPKLMDQYGEACGGEGGIRSETLSLCDKRTYSRNSRRNTPNCTSLNFPMISDAC
jgi:hypothetical protein